MGIITSPKYPEEVRGQHIPMITESQFYKVQAILDGRNVGTPIAARKGRDNEDFPLRRILRCSKCGTSFSGAWSKGRSSRYAYYFCKNRCVKSSIPLAVIETEVRAFLKKMSPSEAGLKLYISRLIKRYNEKMAIINKIKKAADEELKKLQALRQVLVEKNLAGLYSDEVYKEQNTIINTKITAAYASKNDALIDQYNMDKIVDFIKEKLSDLSITYQNSTLSQLRCLLGSIFQKGLVYGYPGIVNREISPIYQSILSSSQEGAPDGDPTGSQFEPTLAWLEHLRLVYEDSEEEQL